MLYGIITTLFDLYSSMDRLETVLLKSVGCHVFKFIFQYGQIRNHLLYKCLQKCKRIYIPVWIDQKQTTQICQVGYLKNLYSSMDRLETFSMFIVIPPKYLFIFQYGQIRNMFQSFNFRRIWGIYIPVWIDQKQKLHHSIITDKCNLYSSMDRLETKAPLIPCCKLRKFIFQYGQIRNASKRVYNSVEKNIYIPVWIDQKQRRKIIRSFYSQIYIPVWIDQKHVKPPSNYLQL